MYLLLTFFVILWIGVRGTKYQTEVTRITDNQVRSFIFLSKAIIMNISEN
jgi:hypothetical protein